jgi:nonribosomal peptide synthetase protein BlmV
VTVDDRLAGLSAAKRELLDRWLSDEPEERDVTAPYTPPRTDVERTLVDIFQQELGAERVGIDDDYFELGGDSIHAIVIVGRAQRAELALDAGDLFAHRTIRALASQTALVEVTPGEPGTAGDSFALTPLQQGMLYHAVGGSTPGAYLVQLRCDLVGPLRPDLFEAAWQAVFAANPTLRTVVDYDSGQEPRQRFVPGLRMPFEVANGDGSFAELLEADRQRGFDLRRGPLMRFTLVPAGPDRHRCVWTYHHLLFDGWSQQLVLRDVLDCYTRLLAGDPAQPPHRPPFTDYLRWLAAQPGTDVAFWQRTLGGPREATRVAGPGCVDGQIVTAARPEVALPLGDDVSAALPAFARRHGITVGSVVHAGWATLLSIHCRLDDVTFGSTVSGRPADLPGATESIGMFVNTLPVRVPCPADAVVLDWLGQVQRHLADVRGHQHEALSQVERVANLAHGAGLFDNIVVVENFPTWIRAGDEVAGLRIENLAVMVEEGYPLVLEFAPGAAAVLRARYDERRMERASVEGALTALAAFVAAVLRDPQATLGDVRAEVAERLRERTDELRRSQRQRAQSGLQAGRRRPVAEDGE